MPIPCSVSNNQQSGISEKVTRFASVILLNTFVFSKSEILFPDSTGMNLLYFRWLQNAADLRWKQDSEEDATASASMSNIAKKSYKVVLGKLPVDVHIFVITTSN